MMRVTKSDRTSSDFLLILSLLLAGLTAAMSSGPEPRRLVSDVIDSVRTSLAVGGVVSDAEIQAAPLDADDTRLVSF